MRDRLSTLSDPQIIELIQRHFVAATDNDWYNRRRKDAVGEFFIKVADQGPRTPPGTRQGHYIFTPSGKLLGYNNNNSVERRLRFINGAINKWEALPANEKKPGAIEVPPLDQLELDPKYHATLPEGGVALVISERILKRSPDGKLTTCSAGDHNHGWGHLAAIDRMWIQESEWKQLIAGRAIPETVAKRLVRYHFLDFTRGEPKPWKNTDVKSLQTEVRSVSDGVLEIEGKVEVSNQQSGFAADFLGKIELNPALRPTRFDMVVLGEHWGDGPYTKGARPGKTPLGIAFSLANPDEPEDRIRPQGSHSLVDYFTAERN